MLHPGRLCSGKYNIGDDKVSQCKSTKNFKSGTGTEEDIGHTQKNQWQQI
jgi:hypothetical protein